VLEKEKSSEQEVAMNDHKVEYRNDKKFFSLPGVLEGGPKE
jgi:hypothetical protein